MLYLTSGRTTTLFTVSLVVWTMIDDSKSKSPILVPRFKRAAAFPYALARLILLTSNKYNDNFFSFFFTHNYHSVTIIIVVTLRVRLDHHIINIGMLIKCPYTLCSVESLVWQVPSPLSAPLLAPPYFLALKDSLRPLFVVMAKVSTSDTRNDKLSTCVSAWILGWFMCKAVAYIQGVSVAASVYSLVAVSLDRYVPLASLLYSRETGCTRTHIRSEYLALHDLRARLGYRLALFKVFFSFTTRMLIRRRCHDDLSLTKQ